MKTRTTKRDLERLVRIAKKQNPGMSQRAAEKLARQVARSLAERRAARG